MSATLAALAIYPVKGCRRVELERAALGPTGLAGDRGWMVTRPDGRFLSQRTHPALARIAPALTAAGLALRCAGLPELLVPADADAGPREVTVWNDRMHATDAGEPAAQWLARVLGEPARLVRRGPATERFATRDWVGPVDVPVSFADAFPLLVCSLSSLEELNARLPAPVPMNRFRPNLVIAGLAPFAEDGIRELEVGALRLRLVKPCTRCTVPAVDQDSGAPSTDPAPALKAFRFDPALRGVTFGVNAVAEAASGAVLEVGAPVRVAA
ncbi:MAG: MOSC N-terminal beta barrel domain-containing protein [Proteobacteria bacterium]|nr:MOSC N-terminal beta barrel domain-containing protein [Pseudomonadota bacterium]